MKLRKLEELQDHCVFEICYAKDFPNHWNKDSLYFSDEDFGEIGEYVYHVFNEYHYYGPQKITIEEWNKIKEMALVNKGTGDSVRAFFKEVDVWFKQINNQNDYFYIIGI